MIMTISLTMTLKNYIPFNHSNNFNFFFVDRIENIHSSLQHGEASTSTMLPDWNTITLLLFPGSPDWGTFLSFIFCTNSSSPIFTSIFTSIFTPLSSSFHLSRGPSHHGGFSTICLIMSRAGGRDENLWSNCLGDLDGNTTFTQSLFIFSLHTFDPSPRRHGPISPDPTE